MNNEKQKNWMKSKVEQGTYEKVEEQQNKSNNNDKILHDITGTLRSSLKG
jgi:hypothetical protein